MEDDIVCLLQDLGPHKSTTVIANFLIRNPDLEEKIAAEMGALLSSVSNDEHILNQMANRASPSISNFMSFAMGGLTQPYKMIFVVNMELNMGRGKQCAQVAHGALALYLDLTKSSNEEVKAGLDQWMALGQRKIVVKGNNLEQLKQIKDEAQKAHIPTHLITDAGCTQIAPGSRTVLALFGKDQELDKITGHLKLL